MKKYYLLLLFVTSFVSAQIVNIPDANFKAKLLSASPTNTVAGNALGAFIKIDTNNDGEIQMSEIMPIIQLNVSGANISDLTGINNFTNVERLLCFQNQLISLDVTGLTLLKDFNCATNLITDLNVSGLTNLKELYCSNNQLSNLNILGLNNLEIIHCSTNQLSSLDLTGLINLKSIYCGWNQLSTINLNGFVNLEDFDCRQNLFSNLDLTSSLNLKDLQCGWNQLTTLDLNSFTSLTAIGCNDNLTLTNVSLKNGSFETYIDFSNCPNLNFICVDESELVNVQSEILENGYLNCNVNTYCSFTPGGKFNTITGSTVYDANNNGCDASDLPQPNIKLNINDGTNQGAIISNNSGNYSFFTQSGSFTLTPDVENPSWFNFSPTSATIPFADNNDNLITQNFCLSANGIHPDVEVVIVPIIPARPGFDAVYKVVYKNKGNQTVGGYVNFTFDDTVLDFVFSSIVPTITIGSTMNWTISNLAPFQSGSILVTFNVNSPQETPAVNIDDILVFNATINLPSDDNLADNNFDLNQIVVGSYDPNDITCLQGNILPTADIGEYLHYNIRFENTGTYAAENIVVKNEIDLTQYNIQSLQVMESSHPVTVRVTGNIAEFIFQGIDLDTGGHGNILLKLKSNTTLSNDLVINSADIFFDYNFPIITNDEQTVFADLSKNDFVKDASIQVYPNPANDILNVKADNTINSIQLYDAQGRLLLTKMANENTQVLDLSSYSSGIYFINISTSVGKQTQKIIKN